MGIECLIEDPAWEEVGLDGLAACACVAALDELGLAVARFEISVLGCSDARIAALNADFRARPQPTNVLSWPAEAVEVLPGEMPELPEVTETGPARELGDIAIAHGVCTRESAAAGKPFEHHVTHLLVHGTLHLLGFDHISDADAALMEGLETRILARLGVPDPY
ncbi:rRNA maturation RNase YbeY [Rhodophyticola sp. CCM32]|uniref:rRNA maturation RNase YbeY n=1 Tax=Rhodophyticola sp. CCM32 TaxID=2916397 RepID=UPI00107F7055|nr:rRNA maturation RNase YbeY [Rhodophyticola sp. CCM32]QBY01563.1 rRNA maturation RNase YbeY [Rhodophyticola sp. CCM32]